MSEKPIDIRAKERKGMSFGRQAMWDAMRTRREFILRDISIDSERDITSVDTYAKRLLAGEYITKVQLIQSQRSSNKNHQSMLYKLIKDIGHEAPRLKKDGTLLIEKRDQMWVAMKMLASFTYSDLAEYASTKESTINMLDAKSYCSHLLRAGYLEVITKASPKNKAVYRLFPTMNTGPLAPKVQRTKVVFDANKNKVMWHEEIDP